MRNRALAADLLGQLAMRRHDYAAAAEYAARSELAGQNYVQFNPSDLSAWDYWIRGKDQGSDTLFERGRVLDSINALRAAVALEQDPRLPSSLGPQLNWTWAKLAGQEARTGQRAAAEKSLREAIRANDELFKVTGNTGQWREVLPLVPDAWRQRLDLYFGDYPAALEGSTANARRLGGLQIPADEENAQRIRANLLRFALGTAAMAALRLGRDAEAESALRERLTLPPNPFSGADPQDETSRSQVMLAHAVTRQGRHAEAREIVQPALERYRAAQARGAGGITFQRDLAYALYANAIAQDDDRAGRAQRQESLAEAAKLLSSLPAEAQQIWDMRTVTDLVAAARGG
jgi:tetratricopeptide (TPR) repeat protein